VSHEPDPVIVGESNNRKEGPLVPNIQLARLCAHSLAAVGVSLACAALIAAERNPSQVEAKKSTQARTPDGQPDISGFYTHVGFGMGKEENPAQLCPGAEGARSNTCYENAWSSDVKAKLTHTLPLDVFEPANGKLPLTPAAAAIKEEYKKSQGDPSLLRHIDTQTRCLHSGVPRSNFAIGYVGYQIIQGAGYVAIYTEYNHEFRFIPLDGRPHLSPSIALFGGDSVGRWEGTSLIVDTTNIAVPAATGFGYLDMQGTPFSAGIHVVERFTLLDSNTIGVEVTVEDAKMYSKPWKTGGAFVRAPKTYEVFEYACHEGNMGMQNLSFRLPKKR
jgi:hypothetical protein